MKIKALNVNYSYETETVKEDEWYKILSKFDDANIYQTWAYGVVRWGEQNLSHIILKKEDEIVAAAQARIFKRFYNLLGIAYISWGPLWRRKDLKEDREILEQIYRALFNEYVFKRRLFLWIMPNEFNDQSGAIREVIENENYKLRPSTYRTIVLDLVPTLEDLRKNLRKSWRYYLKKSEKSDLEVNVGESPQYFDVFFEHYYEMLHRKKYIPGLQVEEFKKMQNMLPNEFKLKLLFCMNKKKPIASVVISAMGNKCIYLLGATTTVGLNYSGSYLLQWKVIELLKNKTYKWYDLNGINPKLNPGVYHFKKGLSGIDTTNISEFEASPNLFIYASLYIIKNLQRIILYLKRFLSK